MFTSENRKTSDIMKKKKLEKVKQIFGKLHVEMKRESYLISKANIWQTSCGDEERILPYK
jgi:hypothetical protein